MNIKPVRTVLLLMCFVLPVCLCDPTCDDEKCTKNYKTHEEYQENCQNKNNQPKALNVAGRNRTNSGVEDLLLSERPRILPKYVERDKLKLVKVVNANLEVLGQGPSTTLLARKMKSSMQNIVPYLLVPALFLSGIMPWIMPGIKMMVMGVSMINQMVFSASLFALVRSYIFDNDKEERIIYVNQGYKNKPINSDRNDRNTLQYLQR